METSAGIAIGLAIGAAATIAGVVVGFFLSMHSYRKGVKLVDNIYHHKAPFDEDLVNEPLDSHTGGRNIDDDED